MKTLILCLSSSFVLFSCASAPVASVRRGPASGAVGATIESSEVYTCETRGAAGPRPSDQISFKIFQESPSSDRYSVYVKHTGARKPDLANGSLFTGMSGEVLTDNHGMHSLELILPAPSDDANLGGTLTIYIADSENGVSDQGVVLNSKAEYDAYQKARNGNGQIFAEVADFVSSGGKKFHGVCHSSSQ